MKDLSYIHYIINQKKSAFYDKLTRTKPVALKELHKRAKRLSRYTQDQNNANQYIR